MPAPDTLKLVGATESEMRDPRVQELMRDMEAAGEPAAARQISASVEPPPADQVPLAQNQLGLERYGIKLRRKTNIHDLFIQRIIAFGLPPTSKWIASYKTDAKTKDKPVPEKVIPETYMPTVFFFVLGAPFPTIEAAIDAGEAGGFYAFFALADDWLASTGIPTDKTEEVWTAILATMQKFSPGDVGAADESTAATPGGTVVKKSAAPGSSSGTD